jgi:hypothetical protein
VAGTVLERLENDLAGARVSLRDNAPVSASHAHTRTHRREPGPGAGGAGLGEVAGGGLHVHRLGQERAEDARRVREPRSGAVRAALPAQRPQLLARTCK